MKPGIALLLHLPISMALTAGEPQSWRFEELGRFTAAEARQGVAADAGHLYAIGNHALAKYRKDTRERVLGWECTEGEPFVHLNAGVVWNGELYCAHSNYPDVPHRSSVEVWDTATLRHARSIDLGETDGSLTWVDRLGNGWIACFAHYGGRGGVPGRGPEATRLVEFDDGWRERGKWTLPADLMARIGGRGYSLSGGAIGPDGRLYVTGHDEPELYVLRFVAEPRTLEWIATVPVPAEGQAFAWDPTESGVIYLILKRTREVISGRVIAPTPSLP